MPYLLGQMGPSLRECFTSDQFVFFHTLILEIGWPPPPFSCVPASLMAATTDTLNMRDRVSQ